MTSRTTLVLAGLALPLPAATALGAGLVTGVVALSVSLAPIWASVAALLGIGAGAVLTTGARPAAAESDVMASDQHAGHVQRPPRA